MCALPQLHCLCSFWLQVATTFEYKIVTFYIFEIWIMMWFPVRIRNTSESQKDLFQHLAELKASMTVEKSNFWSKSLSMFNRDRLFNHSWLESGLSLEQIWCVWGDWRSGARQYNFTAKLVKIMPKMPNCQSQIFTAKRLRKMPDLSYWHLKMSVDNSGQKLEVFTYLTIDQGQ